MRPPDQDRTGQKGVVSKKEAAAAAAGSDVVALISTKRLLMPPPRQRRQPLATRRTHPKRQHRCHWSCSRKNKEAAGWKKAATTKPVNKSDKKSIVAKVQKSAAKARATALLRAMRRRSHLARNPKFPRRSVPYLQSHRRVH
uniref:(northern house mosquito) hypothetical protein n=1 Tax=Culex pipiens TaxID=7175 RepID=A0A8D8B288_CULPI